MKATANQQGIIVRAVSGFGAAEEIAWEAGRRATSPEARIFYRRLAATARSFHVQQNIADWTTDLLLPDPCPENAPDNFWKEIAVAAEAQSNRIPRPAVAVVSMALYGQLESARIEVKAGRRSIVGIPNVELSADERTWIELDGSAIESTGEVAAPKNPDLGATTDSPGGGSDSFQSEAPPDREVQATERPRTNVSNPTLTDSELTDIVAVLRCFYRQGGRARVAVAPCDIIERTGLPLDRVFELLKYLEGAGRIRRLPRTKKRHRQEWLAVARS